MRKIIFLMLIFIIFFVFNTVQMGNFVLAANPNQIGYSLTVIDLTEESWLNRKLEQLSLNTEQTGDFEFIYSENEINILSAKIVDNLVLSAEKSQQKSLSIANPTLRTEVGTTAYINLSEEILNWEQKELKTQLIDFSTELTPLNLTSKGEIESEVRFSVNSGTDFSTTVRLAAGETKLIGFLKLKENKVNDRLQDRNQNKRKRTYAIYLSSNIADLGPAASLDGLDKLLFKNKEPVFRLNNQYLQIIFTEKYSSDIDFQYQTKNKKNILNFKSREDFSYLELGLEFSITDGLFIDSKGVFEDNNYKVLLGFDDIIQFSKNLSLTAGLYPFVFSLTETKFEDYAAYTGFNYIPGPLVFNLNYFHNLEIEVLRLETGLKIKKLPYLMVAAAGNFDGLEQIFAGMRFQF
ncbi:MAG TPA: hypothetical protein VJ881_05820 [Halanaerobiales bacterium]|nr:hypothetical protein [Halanaerobiales bacterium]